VPSCRMYGDASCRCAVTPSCLLDVMPSVRFAVSPSYRHGFILRVCRTAVTPSFRLNGLPSMSSPQGRGQSFQSHPVPSWTDRPSACSGLPAQATSDWTSHHRASGGATALCSSPVMLLANWRTRDPADQPPAVSTSPALSLRGPRPPLSPHQPGESLSLSPHTQYRDTPLSPRTCLCLFSIPRHRHTPGTERNVTPRDKANSQYAQHPRTGLKPSRPQRQGQRLGTGRCEASPSQPAPPRTAPSVQTQPTRKVASPYAQHPVPRRGAGHQPHRAGPYGPHSPPQARSTSRVPGSLPTQAQP
jgi:hypothetical protein